MRAKEIAILGCGPSGLLAAHAVERAGHKPVIFSRKEKSVMPGAQYLHHTIPGLTVKGALETVRFVKSGTKEGYASKVYGNPRARCSWDLFPEGERPAWSINEMYDELWERYKSSIVNTLVLRDEVGYFADQYPLVLSSIPIKSLCEHDKVCRFAEQEVWIREYMRIEGAKNIVMYNGDPFTPWYRSSTLFGYRSVEYGHPVENAVRGIKPLWTTCRCHPQLKRIGRFGRWEKSILVTDAFKESLHAVQSL